MTIPPSTLNYELNMGKEIAKRVFQRTAGEEGRNSSCSDLT
jgi:hypothetical protein